MKKRWYAAAGALLALVCLLAFFLLRPAPAPSAVEEAVQQSVMQARSERAEEPLPETAEEAAPYVSPVDFESLRTMNEDIYAWLDIPGTDISFPILQREGDDGYYLRRNSQGENDMNGVIFTEGTYNSKDFTDPATVVYGHHMRSGAMFGHLQETYSSLEGLREYGEIIIYLPEEEIRYQVFAGIPFSNIHVLYYYDFSKPYIYEAFLEHIRSIRGIDANVDDEIAVTPEDQMLILSTCLQGNNQRRYLVLAKRIDDRTSMSNMED